MLTKCPVYFVTQLVGRVEHVSLAHCILDNAALWHMLHSDHSGPSHARGEVSASQVAREEWWWKFYHSNCNALGPAESTGSS